MSRGGARPTPSPMPNARSRSAASPRRSLPTIASPVAAPLGHARGQPRAARPDERARFAELAVFVEDAEIPTTVAIGLWRQTAALDPLDGEDLLARLAELSLLSSLTSAAALSALHDVVRKLLREGPVKGPPCGARRPPRRTFPRASDEHPRRLSDVYGLRHLDRASQRRRARSMQRARCSRPGVALKQACERLGIQPLLADYAMLCSRDAPLDLIRAALTLAAPASRATRGTCPQLLARLAPGDAAGWVISFTRTQRCLRRRWCRASDLHCAWRGAAPVRGHAAGLPA